MNMIADTDKLKIKVIGIPMNMKGELVLDFRNTQSVSVSLYPKYRTVDISERLNVQGPIKIQGIQVLTSQQPAISNSVGGDESAKINAILAMLRLHGIIKT